MTGAPSSFLDGLRSCIDARQADGQGLAILLVDCGLIARIDAAWGYHVGDAVREGKPVFTNDYPGLVKPTKKGYPQGHVNVRRHMNLPIRDGGKIVMIIGVGNKRDPYNAEDAQVIQDLMTEVWKALKLKV